LVFFSEDEDDIVYEKETEDTLFIDYIRLLKDFLESLVFKTFVNIVYHNSGDLLKLYRALLNLKTVFGAGKPGRFFI